MRQLFAGAFQTAFGKDRITCFHRIYFLEKERRLELMELLRESIEHGFAGFSVAYQPQVEAATGKLFRRGGAGKMDLRKVWQHIAGRIYTALERSGLINQLGR